MFNGKLPQTFIGPWRYTLGLFFCVCVCVCDAQCIKFQRYNNFLLRKRKEINDLSQEVYLLYYQSPL